MPWCDSGCVQIGCTDASPSINDVLCESRSVSLFVVVDDDDIFGVVVVVVAAAAAIVVAAVADDVTDDAVFVVEFDSELGGAGSSESRNATSRSRSTSVSLVSIKLKRLYLCIEKKYVNYFHSQNQYVM